jgi:glycosyltransferase involved in cell wall biosynthesis
LKILYICDEYPPGKTGGIGAAVSLLAEKLSKTGHQVFVVGLYPPGFGGKDYEVVNDNLKVWRFRYLLDSKLVSSSDPLKEKWVVKALRISGLLKIDCRIQFRRMWKFIKQLTEANQIEIIETPDWNNYYFNTGSIQSIPEPGVPLVVKLHGSDSYFRKLEGKKISKKMLQQEKYLLNRADAVSSVSRFTAQLCKELYSYSKPIEVVYNGVEVYSFYGIDHRPDENKVVFSGSLMKKKGVFSLMKAWNLVVKQLPTARLYIYGKGDPAFLKSLLTGSAVDTVFFKGHIKRSELLKELQTCALSVFPSYAETFGMGAAEAMGTGCPVIFTTRTSGPELIENEKEGLLIDPDNTGELSKAIIRLLSDRALRERMGMAAYHKAKTEFEISHVCNVQLKYYESVISAFRKG